MEKINILAKSSGINKKVLEEICLFAKKYKLDIVYLFGSRARGDYKLRSDIDLAITGGNTTDFSLDVNEETSTLLEFDIVNLDKNVQDELEQSIKREGKILYEKIR